ncbi:hypothetical protein J2801_005091 [Paraburkholderia phenoliruptrix]|nr:hypothetical protein [Paraburkholderia phenoliruptrix]
MQFDSGGDRRAQADLAVQSAHFAAGEHACGGLHWTGHPVGRIDQYEMLERRQPIEDRVNFLPDIRLRKRRQCDEHFGPGCIEQIGYCLAFEQWVDCARNARCLSAPDDEMRLRQVGQHVRDHGLRRDAEPGKGVRRSGDVTNQFAIGPAFGVAINVGGHKKRKRWRGRIDRSTTADHFVGADRQILRHPLRLQRKDVLSAHDPLGCHDASSTTSLR